MVRFQVLFSVLAVLLSLQVRADNQTLIKKIHDQISQHQTPLSYSAARQLMFGRLYLEDHKGTYFVHDVYCQKDFTQSDFSVNATVGPNRIPDAAILNTEHTWPQSRFTKKYPADMQKTDLHHLFPSDSKMNALRGNNKFGEVASEVALPCNTAALGHANGGWRFEPPPEHRGNVARALFYFSVRYEIHIDADEEQALRKWNVEDPVDAAEKSRNDAIEKLQGNRNPFIDDPKLADQISDF